MIKVGNKQVNKVQYGTKRAYEVSYGPDLKIADTSSITSWSKTLVEINEWKPQGTNTTAGVTTNTNNFCFNSTDKSVTTIVSSTGEYNDNELNIWATATNAETSGTTMLVTYTFGCATNGTFNLPNWIKDILRHSNETGRVVNCSFSANIYAKTETGKVRDKNCVGLKPAKTDCQLLLRQNDSALGDAGALSAVVSSGLVAVERSIIGTGSSKSENTATGAININLRSNTESITWACLFSPIRIAVGRECDYSLHTATFSNIRLVLTIS